MMTSRPLGTAGWDFRSPRVLWPPLPRPGFLRLFDGVRRVCLEVRGKLGLTAQVTNTAQAFEKPMLHRVSWNVWRPDGLAVVCFECSRTGIPSTTKGTALPAWKLGRSERYFGRKYLFSFLGMSNHFSLLADVLVSFIEGEVLSSGCSGGSPNLLTHVDGLARMRMDRRVCVL